MGLKWGALSHGLALEEPDGIACIVAALNERASAQMMMHEMETIRTLARTCTTSAATADEVALHSARAKLHGEGFSVLAESPGLPHLFRFVLEQGCDSATGIMEPLYTFHEKFVNAKTRRLREHHFKDVCTVDDAWLRLILLQCAYGVKRDKIRDTWVECFGPSVIGALMKTKMKDFLEQMSTVVNKFHRTYAALAAYEHFPAGHKNKFLGRLGMQLGQILLTGDDLDDATTAMHSTTWKFEQEMREGIPAHVLEKLGEPMGKQAPAAGHETTQADSNTTHASSSRGGTVQKRLLVTFDEHGNASKTLSGLAEMIVRVKRSSYCHGHSRIRTRTLKEKL